MSDEQQAIIDALRNLPSDEERKEVFARFCEECGSCDPFCQCWNDE